MGKAPLNLEGKRVLKMLVEKYSMQEDMAVKLIKDGGASLAIALLNIAR